MCGIAVGAFILAVPGVASAQLDGGLIGGDVGLVDDVNVVAPILSPNSDNAAGRGQFFQNEGDVDIDDSFNRTVIRDNVIRDSFNRDSFNEDNDTVIIRRHGGHPGHGHPGHGHPGHGHPGHGHPGGGDVDVDNRNNNVNRNDIYIDIDNRNQQSQAQRQDLDNRVDQATVIDNNDNVVFLDRNGDVHFADGRKSTLHKAVLAGHLPASLLTHKQLIFPHRFALGSFASGSGGGGLAKTGQDYGLAITAALGMITAGVVVTRMSRLNLRPAIRTVAPDDTTLVMSELDEFEAEVEVNRTEEVLVEPAWTAAGNDLESEIAALRRQLDEVAPATVSVSGGSRSAGAALAAV